MVRNADPGMHPIPITPAEQITQQIIPLLERQVDDAVATKPLAIELNLSGVKAIDSAGLNWIVGIQNRLDTLGIRLRIIDPSPIVADIFLATRLDARFTIQMSAAKGGSDGRD
jgi:anti-anti-sigma factor